jgi:hypothetical protein
MNTNTTTNDVASLPDDELLNEVRRLAQRERQATAALIQSLMEVDARRLYLREGCSSHFTYCTQVLHLEEGAAYYRFRTIKPGAYPEDSRTMRAPWIHVEVSGDLRDDTRGPLGAHGLGVRRALVAAEIALACVLVTCAGPLVRSFAAIQSDDPGSSASASHHAPHTDGRALSGTRERADAARRAARVMQDGFALTAVGLGIGLAAAALVASSPERLQPGVAGAKMRSCERSRVPGSDSAGSAAEPRTSAR